ncbi:MAG: fumarylacetoacetase [Flavobacteriaceae bacterium]|nr:MAG: fumarylacetoacetase [Flavobacteriaceae bacterium]
MTKLKSWIPVDITSDFSIYNLPFGIFSTENRSPRIGVAIGDKVVDVLKVYNLGVLSPKVLKKEIFDNLFLNDFIALGKSVTNEVRLQIQDLLIQEQSLLKNEPDVLVEQAKCTMHLPVRIGDYTDFYSSIEHATNLGSLFRDPDNALLPNWKHLPVAYHGRASSIYVSGTPVIRPNGQRVPKGEINPVYGPSTLLDIELEMGFIIGKDTEMGESISTGRTSDYIFGMVMLNDWSARDIQKWEYVPLGPFLGKNFASTISPWIVTLEALEFAKIEAPKQDVEVLDYLKCERLNYDIELHVDYTPNKGIVKRISVSNFKYMYWTMSQQLAHHTVNGCNVRVGDMMASGTISGPTPESYGSLLEMTKAGKHKIVFEDGMERTFLQDYDAINLSACAVKNDIRVGFGECKAQIIPAK